MSWKIYGHLSPPPPPFPPYLEQEVRSLNAALSSSGLVSPLLHAARAFCIPSSSFHLGLLHLWPRGLASWLCAAIAPHCRDTFCRALGGLGKKLALSTQVLLLVQLGSVLGSLERWLVDGPSSFPLVLCLSGRFQTHKCQLPGARQRTLAEAEQEEVWSDGQR